MPFLSRYVLYCFYGLSFDYHRDCWLLRVLTRKSFFYRIYSPLPYLHVLFLKSVVSITDCGFNSFLDIFLSQ